MAGRQRERPGRTTDIDKSSKEELSRAHGYRKTMTDCKHFLTCNANLCPLDPDMDRRSWLIGEAVCKHKGHKDLPMLRRQKQLNRLKPDKYERRPLLGDWLRRTAPKKISLSPEEKAERLARLHRGGSRQNHFPTQGNF